MAELFFKDPTEYIKLEFHLRKNRRPHYSMRAFARDLSFSPSSLTDFMKGRVGMSDNRILQLSNRLDWSKDRTLHFSHLIKAKFEKDAAKRQTSQMQVKIKLKDKSSYFDLNEFKVISDWYNLVIIEICHLEDNITIEKLVDALGITSQQVKTAIKNLKQLEIIQETDHGLKPLRSTHQFGDEAPSDAIKNFHSQILQLAQRMVFERNYENRESHSLVFTISSEKIHEMNKEIRKSLYDIVNKFSVESNLNAVQIVSLQSFPIYKSSTCGEKL
jgi:uncharacterized protein (TIGR02147 family)